MIAASVALAALAGFLGARNPRSISRLSPQVVESAKTGMRPRFIGVAVAASLFCVALGLLAGPVWGVVTWCLFAVSGTTLAIGLARRRRRTSESMAAQVARGCAIVAAECRLGRISAQALAVAAQDVAILAPAAGAVGLGGEAVAVWEEQSRRPGCHGLRQLSRAWQVSARTGAPLADLISVVAADLRQRQALDRVVNAELAAPRATSHLLAVLPLFGLLLGQIAGAQPMVFLTSNRYGLGCLALGTILTCAGALWAEWLAKVPGEGRS